MLITVSKVRQLALKIAKANRAQKFTRVSKSFLVAVDRAAKDYIQQMKAVDPTIRIGATGSSLAWFQTVLTTAAADIDYLDVHDYPNYGWPAGYESFRTGNPVFTTFADLAIAAIQAYAPVADRSRLKVVLSETGAFDYTAAWPDRSTPHRTLSRGRPRPCRSSL